MLRGITIIVGLSLLIAVGGFSVIVFGRGVIDSSYWAHEIVREHARAVIGVPLAVMTAAAIVYLFNQSMPDKLAELKGFGFEFKGPASGVVLWALAFGFIAGAIRLLW